MTSRHIISIMTALAIATYYSGWLWMATHPSTLSLTPPSIEAHPGIMSTVYLRKFDQIQALIDSGVPMIDFKNSVFPQEGGTIYLWRTIPMPLELRGGRFLADGSGHIFYFGEPK